MKNGSWEEFYYDGEPSPMERVIIICRDCRSTCMGYHERKWREVTRGDMFYSKMINFYYLGICPECWEVREKEGSLAEIEDE